MSKTYTPQLLLSMLETGSVELELWGDVEPAKLVGVGADPNGYALVKVWDRETCREVIELVELSVIKEVRLSA